MEGEKVGNLSLYIYSTFQNNICDGIPNSIMGYNVLTFTQASKEMDTQIITNNVKNV